MSNPGGNFGPTTMAMGEENTQQNLPPLPGGSNMMTMAVPENGQPQDPRDMFGQGKLPVRPDGSMVNTMTDAIPENGQPQGQYTGAITRALGEEGNPPMPGGGQIMTTASPEGGQQPGFDNSNISGPTTLMEGEESGQQPPMAVTAALGETNQQPGMNNSGLRRFMTEMEGENNNQQPPMPGGNTMTRANHENAQQPPMQRPPMFGGFNPFGGFGGYGGFGGGFGNPFGGFGGGFSPFGGMGGYGSPFMGFGSYGGFGGFNPFGGFGNMGGFGGGFGQQRQPMNFGGGFGNQQQMAPNLTQQRFSGY